MKRNWQEARDSGVCFYELPDALDYAMLDPMMRGVCSQINASGWVATGESCQGHVDDTTGIVWVNNLGPFLRLICHRKDYGTMLAILTLACGAAPNGPAPWPLPLRIFRNDPHGEWESVNLYIDARTTHERDQGIGALLAFALYLTTPAVVEQFTAALPSVGTPETKDE